MPTIWNASTAATVQVSGGTANAPSYVWDCWWHEANTAVNTECTLTCNRVRYSDVWYDWVESGRSAVARSAWSPTLRARVPTAEEQAQLAEAQRLDITAQERAEAALIEHLTADELARFQRERLVVVKGSAGRLYRLSAQGELYQVDAQGKRLEHLCVHPGHEYPAGDHALTKLLWLRTDEDGLRRIANITRVAA